MKSYEEQKKEQLKRTNDFYGQQLEDATWAFGKYGLGGYTNSVAGLANQGLVLKIARASDLSSPITFVAFMESMNDNFNQNFNKDSVFGRQDPIQSFKNTERQMSMSWKLVAGNETEARRNMANISNLTRLMYPSYQGTSVTEAPVMAIRYMNLVWDSDAPDDFLHGTISSLSITPDMEFGVLQAMGPGDFAFLPGEILPKVFTLALSFSPIHYGVRGNNQLEPGHLYKGALGSAANNLPVGDGTPVRRAIPPGSAYEDYVQSQTISILSAQTDEQDRIEQPWKRVSDKWKALFKSDKEKK